MKPQPLGNQHCPYCNETTEIYLEDFSFSHAFGTEHNYRPVCSQCQEPVEFDYPNKSKYDDHPDV